MEDLPYSFEPSPGYQTYKVTSMLKDYLTLLMEETGNQQTIDQILKLINDYVLQLKNLTAQNIKATTNQVYNAIDNFFINAPEESKKEIKCKTGCTACCFIELDISANEATVIVDYCKENNIEVDKAYLTEQAAAGRSTYSPLSRCVFLKDNLCSIYPVRPVACRKHWVKTDPTLCDFSENITNQIGSYFNINTEILASAMLNVNEAIPFEKALLREMEQRPA